MILHIIKRNLALLNVGGRQHPNFIDGVQSQIKPDNSDRLAMRKRIQVAYRISAQEAEGQISAAENRRQKLVSARSTGIFFRPR
jgi:hypothetical protein